MAAKRSRRWHQRDRAWEKEGDSVAKGAAIAEASSQEHDDQLTKLIVTALQVIRMKPLIENIDGAHKMEDRNEAVLVSNYQKHGIISTEKKGIEGDTETIHQGSMSTRFQAAKVTGEAGSNNKRETAANLIGQR
ncbi:hypothetical protein L1887_13999 [Cichorium endivia]|nr:hypothetical protein L1887_13999 [Cichorium endivia]